MWLIAGFPTRWPGFALGLVMWDLCGQSGTGAGFLLLLLFPLRIIIPPVYPSSSSSPDASAIGQFVADLPSGPSWIHPPLFELKKIP
jgi:hypothetical protein